MLKVISYPDYHKTRNISPTVSFVKEVTSSLSKYGHFNTKWSTWQFICLKTTATSDFSNLVLAVYQNAKLVYSACSYKIQDVLA